MCADLARWWRRRAALFSTTASRSRASADPRSGRGKSARASASPFRLVAKVISHGWRTTCRSCEAGGNAAPPIGNDFWQLYGSCGDWPRPKCERSWNLGLNHRGSEQGKSRRSLSIFPVVLFALCHPFDGGLEAFGACFLALGFGDPRDVLAFAAWTELLERGQRRFVLPDGGHEVIRHDEFLLWLYARGGFDAGFVEFDCALDVAGQRFVAGQVVQRSEPPELSHGAILIWTLVHEELALPEIHDAVLLERRHAEQDALVLEVRAVPLHGFLHGRTRGVDQLAEVAKNGSGEIGGLGDIPVHARVVVLHGRRIKRAGKFSTWIAASDGEGAGWFGAAIHRATDN